MRLWHIPQRNDNMDNSQNPPKFSQQPHGKRIDFLKTIVAPQTEMERGSPAPPLDNEEIGRMRKIVSADYDKWVRALGLRPVPLDVYGYYKTSDAKTQHGTSVTNSIPGYDGCKIVLPLAPDVTRQDGIVEPDFPPTSWDGKPPAWPTWRVDLLHEVVHQVEDQVLGLWSGKENLLTYSQAIDNAAAHLSRIKAVTPVELQLLTVGFKERTLR
jgi:hypothetical protein